MLKSLKLFLTYDILDDDFEKFNCDAPMPYQYLLTKTENKTSLKVRKEWITELLLYERYVEEFSSIRASNLPNKVELLHNLLSKWKETLRVTTFCGFNDVKRFYKLYEEYQKFKYIGCKICTVCGCRRRVLGGSLRMLYISYIFLSLTRKRSRISKGWFILITIILESRLSGVSTLKRLMISTTLSST